MRRLAWALWGVTVALAATWPFLAEAAGTQEGDLAGYILFPIAILGYATVGALISARSGNRIGWLLAVLAFALAVGLAAGAYAKLSFDVRNTPLPLAVWVAWLGRVALPVVFGCVPLIFLLFPTGHVPSARWRWVLWLMLVSLDLAIVLIAFTPGVVDEGFTELQTVVSNPVGLPLSWHTTIERVTETAGMVAFVGSFLCVLSLVLRYRRAPLDQRQQIRWLVYVGAVAAAIPILGLVLSAVRALFGQDVAAENDVIGNVMFFGFFGVLMIGVPAACAVAILRYRLWDLDIVVKKTVVFAIVATGLTLVAMVIVLGLPVGVFGTGLTGWERGLFLVGVAIGTLFGPLRRIARRWADRIVYGRRATPYEVLTAFGERVGETYSTEDVLPRMAQLLASGTGASSARVLLRIGVDLREVARWPEQLDRPEDTHTVPVSDRGEELGALSVSMPANDPMDPSKERLLHDLASQIGLLLRNVKLVEELRASRQRLVVAQDERARKLERDIHDGAQQQIVALSIKVGLAEQLAARDPDRSAALLAEIKEDATDALDTLRDLARGIYPPLLADQGLVVALEAQARKSPIPVSIEADGLARYPQGVESAVYFCALEALNNVVKYAGATRVEVRLAQADGQLTFSVTDDGLGFDLADAGSGTGLQGMADRLDAISGALEVRSVRGAGTTVAGRVPVPGDTL